MGSWTEKAMAVVFVLAACFLSLLYGYASYRYELFPHGVFQQAVGAYRQVTRSEDPSFYPTGLRPEDLVAPAPSAQPGLTLLTLIDQDERMAIRVVDLDGSVVLDRVVDWFELWPNPEHRRRDDAHAPNDPDRALPAPTPRSRPGTHIHGIALMDDGDFVFNFEHLGLIRIDACGKPEWRLPYRTHHSVHVDDADGTIWVSGQVNHYQVSRELPNHVPSFAEYTAFQVPPEGKILREISIPKILAANGLVGLLYLSNNANRRTDVTGDTLHLNDVETFPASAPEGFLKRGDVMVSSRNINTVLVFEAGSGKLRYLNACMFARQHDPDFLDG